MENTTRITINQHELMELVSQGVHTNSLDAYNVIASEKIEMDWKGDDGKTLGYHLFHNERWLGFKVMMKHSGMDFTTCCAYIQSHWSFWREHMDKLLV